MMRYLAIVAVIAIAVGLTWQQSHQPQRVVGQTSEIALQQWPQIASAQVESITIHHEKINIQLQRRDSSWVVVDSYGETAANPDLVSRLLTDTTNMQPQRVISTNPKNFDLFRLTNNADHLILKGQDGAILLDLLVGKPGTDLISTTVRQAGKRTIINVNRSLGWQLGRTPSSWHAQKIERDNNP